MSYATYMWDLNRKVGHEDFAYCLTLLDSDQINHVAAFLNANGEIVTVDTLLHHADMSYIHSLDLDKDESDDYCFSNMTEPEICDLGYSYQLEARRNIS